MRRQAHSSHRHFVINGFPALRYYENECGTEKWEQRSIKVKNWMGIERWDGRTEATRRLSAWETGTPTFLLNTI